MSYNEPLIVNQIDDLAILNSILHEKFHLSNEIINVTTETILTKWPDDHIVYMVYSIAEAMSIISNEIDNPKNTISSFTEDGYAVLEDALIYSWKMNENCVLSRDQFNLSVNFIFIIKKLIKPLVSNLLKPLIPL